MKRIEGSYEKCGLSLELIRKYFRSCDEYLATYNEGATGDNITQIMKEKRKHRGPAPMFPEEQQKNTYNREREFNISDN